jgi:hypothetical protein
VVVATMVAVRVGSRVRRDGQAEKMIRSSRHVKQQQATRAPAAATRVAPGAVQHKHTAGGRWGYHPGGLTHPVNADSHGNMVPVYGGV